MLAGSALGLLFLIGVSYQADRCDSLPALALDLTIPPWDPATGPSERIYDWIGERWEAQLGVGHLRPEDSYYVWDWWTEGTRVPLLSGPGDEAWGWFADGQLVEDEGSRRRVTPVGEVGMVETGYEVSSFIVLEKRDDGWLRFRYGKPERSRDGTAWTHECYLGLGEKRLVYETWQERFLSDSISPLYFRSDVPHALRAEPDEASERLRWISGSYHLEPLEFRGDWLRVRVKTPSDYCTEIDSRVYQGWIKWRSADKGPWIWYYTRGC